MSNFMFCICTPTKLLPSQANIYPTVGLNVFLSPLVQYQLTIGNVCKVNFNQGFDFIIKSMICLILNKNYQNDPRKDILSQYF